MHREFTKRICSACVVRHECLDDALTELSDGKHEVYGVRAGGYIKKPSKRKSTA